MVSCYLQSSADHCGEITLGCIRGQANDIIDSMIILCAQLAQIRTPQEGRQMTNWPVYNLSNAMLMQEKMILRHKLIGYYQETRTICSPCYITLKEINFPLLASFSSKLAYLSMLPVI